jgi:hypothetical protein
MKPNLRIIITAALATTFVGLFFGTANFVVSSASAVSTKNPLETLTHVTVQNTTTSVQDPFPGYQAHQVATILPFRSDGKLWVGTVTWTASKPVEFVVLHGYTNVNTADAAHGVPFIAKPPTGAVAITLIGPNEFMPSSNPVPSGTAPFVGSAVGFHTLSGAKFTVTYSVDTTANTPTK